MNRREFLLKSALAGSGLVTLSSCSTTSKDRTAKELCFKLASGKERPSGFRITLSDNKGNSLEPLSSLASFAMQPGAACSYGRDTVTFVLQPGTYHFVASAGPEWSMHHGTINAADLKARTVELAFDRVGRPREMGWMSADNHLHPWPNPIPEMEAVCGIEGVDLCGIQFFGSYTERQTNHTPPQSPTFQKGSIWVSTDQEIEMHSPWGPWEDASVIGIREKLPDVRAGIGYVMNRHFFAEARRRGCSLIVYQAPTWAQFPVALALGLVDSVNLCDNYLSVARRIESPCEYPYFLSNDPLQGQPHGIARWIFDHYYRAINAGFALPVSGGSAFPNGGGGGPIGMCRFYVNTGESPRTPDSLYSYWRRGRTFATNGPLIFASVDGSGPCAELLANMGEKSSLAIDLVSNRPVRTLEWVADGEVVASRSLTGRDCLTTRWETELDLRKYQWVAARCFGESERTLFPAGGRVSPPFLTAHTSPVYLPRFSEITPARQRAQESLLAHFRWMETVAKGDVKTEFDVEHLFKGNPLSGQELRLVQANLHEATHALGRLANKKE